MLKEVDANGQISLGKEYAGREFDVIIHPGNRIELIPVRDGATTQAEETEWVQAPDGWVPPGGYDACNQWALDNRAAVEHYARQIEDEGTAAEQLQRYLDEHPELT